MTPWTKKGRAIQEAARAEAERIKLLNRDREESRFDQIDKVMDIAVKNGDFHAFITAAGDARFVGFNILAASAYQCGRNAARKELENGQA